MVDTQNDDDQPSFEGMRAERDAAHQELADLRAWLTVKLRLARQSPGPEGLTVLAVASDREIIAKPLTRCFVDALRFRADLIHQTACLTR